KAQQNNSDGLCPPPGPRHLRKKEMLRFTNYKSSRKVRICDALRIGRRPPVACRLRVCPATDAERLRHLRATRRLVQQLAPGGPQGGARIWRSRSGADGDDLYGIGL